MKKLICAALLLVSASGASAANILTNGDFETGDLSGWTNVTGRFYADDNTDGGTSPVSGHSTPYNANGGNRFAVGDMSGPGTEILLQTFTVAGGALTLKFDWFNNSYAAQTGDTLVSGQSNRVDILSATAGAYDVGAGVLANLLLNQTSSVWKSEVHALNLAAGSYQLRFASSTYNFYQNFGVDNVSLEPVVADVPAPAALGLFGLGAFGLGLARRRRKA